MVSRWVTLVYGPGSFRPEAGTERCNLSVPNLSFFPDRIAPVAI